MANDLKFLVNEINEILSTDYNLISLDSMPGDVLLQVFVDVLAHFKATNKFDVKLVDREETIHLIFDALKKIQYRPTEIDPNDPSSFRRNIAQGDKKTIYPIMRYVFEKKDKIGQLIYLARFLLPLNVPQEALANPEIANLWDDYQQLMEKFKEEHKNYTESAQENAKLKELKNDLSAIEIEKENVRKRIERTQVRLDRVPQQELLLEAAAALRIEKERQKELDNQLEEQKLEQNRNKTREERLQKELAHARMASQGITPDDLINNLVEETQVLEYMVNDKLPEQLKALQAENKLLEMIVNEPNIDEEYLRNLQKKIDIATGKIQKITEQRLAQRDNEQYDALIPFRQQAAIVAKNKEEAAEKLNQVTNELREVESELQTQQKLLETRDGEVILRGDDLKQYVNTLRAKSSVYKQQRAELAAVQSEVSDLEQTLENLKSQDPTLISSLEEAAAVSTDEDPTSIGIPLEERSITELTRLVEGVTQAVNAARERLTPLSQKLRLMQERIADLKDERDAKKQIYDNLDKTLKAEAALLEGQINEVEKEIKDLEKTWQDLKIEQERSETLLKNIEEEVEGNNTGKPSIKETLQQQLSEEQKRFEALKSEISNLTKNEEYRAKQFTMWTDVLRLLEAKKSAIEEVKKKGIGGTLSIEKNSETFTLQ